MPPAAPSRPPLDLEALRERAPDWFRIDVVPEAPSTNRMLMDSVRSHPRDDPHGRVLVAEHQTAGRGRLNRTWATPDRAALTFSVIARPQLLDPERWQWLPLLLGVAVADGVAAAGGPLCRLKWPNDVMYDDLKLGGLLVERVETPHGPAAVLGVGLNVSTTRAELPVPLASSLWLAGWNMADRTVLLAEILRALSARLEDLQGVMSALRKAYVDLCDTVGRVVRVSLPDDRSLLGRAERIDLDGALVVRTEIGDVRVSAGDVVHVRPAGPA